MSIRANQSYWNRAKSGRLTHRVWQQEDQSVQLDNPRSLPFVRYLIVGYDQAQAPDIQTKLKEVQLKNYRRILETLI